MLGPSGMLAYQMQRSLDGLVAHRVEGFLADDAEIEYPGASAPMTKHQYLAHLERIRADTAAKGIKAVRFHVNRIVADGDEVVVTWTCTSERGNGERPSYPGVTVTSWRHGVATRMTVYTDPALVHKYGRLADEKGVAPP